VLALEIVGREEIKEIEEDSTETESQREQERRMQQTKTGPGRPVDRARSTARSIDVHDVHRHGPVDRRSTGGQSPVDRSVNRCAQTWLSRPPGRPWQGTVDRPVDRLKSSCFRLVPVDQAGRPRTRVGQPAGRPTDGFVSFLDSDSFSVLGSNPNGVS